MALRSIDEVRELYYGQGLWGARTISEIVDSHARAFPDRAALVEGETTHTYGDVSGLTDRLATLFRQIGVEPGDLVAVQLPNKAAFALCHLALNKISAIMLPLGVSWRGRELEMLLGFVRIAAAVVPSTHDDVDHPAMYAEVAGLPPSSVLTVGPEPGEQTGSLWERLPSTSDPVVAREASTRRRGDPDTFSFVNVSSGTTSTPKVSMWTDNNVIAKTLFQFRERTGLAQDDVSLAIAPISLGSTGYQYAVLAQLLVGATSTLLVGWDPSDANDMLSTTGASMTTVIPTQLIKMLADDSVTLRSYELRCITYAGAPLPPEIARRAEHVYGCRIQTVYGATDGGVPTMTAIHDPPAKRYHTVGRPLRGEEVRVLDEIGEPVPSGQLGEIAWRGCNKSLGYLADDVATDKVFVEGGWYLSGDLGRLDGDGYLHVEGRKTDMIIRGGQNINPREIEELLIQHPSVHEVAVVGYADDVLGERACACIVPEGDEHVTLDELRRYFDSLDVAVWKVPERIEYFDELPRSSASAKVLKRELRRLVSAPTGEGARE